jgi:hypothetical protein
MRCAVRAVIGFGLLVGLALTGVEHITATGFIGEPSGSANAMAKANVLAPSPTLTPAPRASGIFQTLAAADVPIVKAAPDAPHAAPIDPIVAPVKKAAPAPVAQPTNGKPKMPATVAQGSNGKTAPKAGFKLSCTSSQKLDTVKKRCIPLKGTALASAKI